MSLGRSRRSNDGRLQVDLEIPPDTTSPRRHLGCHPSWGWEPTGANMTIYPRFTTHLLQGLSADHRICSNSTNPLSIVIPCYSAITVKLSPTAAFNQTHQAICNTVKRGLTNGLLKISVTWGDEQLMYNKIKVYKSLLFPKQFMSDSALGVWLLTGNMNTKPVSSIGQFGD